jgi:hypothetical protein
VPAKVRRTVNLAVAGGVGSPVTGAAKARGAIQNVPDRGPGIGHFSIIAAHERQVLGYVLAATHAHAAPAPREAQASGAAN